MRLLDTLVFATFPLWGLILQNPGFHQPVVSCPTPIVVANLEGVETPASSDPKAGISYCPCTVSHDGLNMTLPFFSNNASATAFYSYSNPLGSCANSGFEQSEHLILMLYEDTNTGDVSFIFIADEPNDGTGGTMKVTFSCMPNSSYIALQDDAGEFSGSPPTFTGNFVWDQCCTDGGIISGLGCGYSFKFDIDDLTGIDVITLLYGSPANPVYVNIPSSECPFIINCGGQVCCENNFTLEGVVENANCTISNEGSIDLELVGDCLQSAAFEWSNGETTEDIANLEVGTYSVTVTDNNGCSAEESFTIGAEYSDPEPVIDSPPWICEGEVLTLSVDGNYTAHAWSNGENTSSIFISGGGTYSVTVTNEGGCTGTASVTIDQYPAPVPVITGPLEICPGGLIELAASLGFSVYDWSNGDYNPKTLITDPGFYTVVVTSAFGCTGEATVEVVGLIGPDPFIFGPDSICTGQTIILELDAAYDSYQWSTGDSLPQTEVKAPGIYSVTVTNDEGCPGVALKEVFDWFAIPLAIIGDSIGCAGDTTILHSSGAFFSYLWSTGDSTFQIQVAAPGTYSLEVTDAFGCRDSATLFIDTFASVQVQIAGNTLICPGDTAQLSADPGYSAYFWSTGETTQAIKVTMPGTYSVVVEDMQGCIGEDSVTVVRSKIDTTLLMATSCHPLDTGVFQMTFINQFGCDSVTILSVSYNLADTLQFFKTSCNPLNTGVDVLQLTNQYGCDSVVITTTSLLPSDITLIGAQSCNPAVVGLDTMVLPNQWGCDSTIITETLIVLSDTTILNTTTCDPLLADTSVTLLVNQFGCDSLIIKSVALLPGSTDNYTFFSCNPLDTGTMVQTFINQFGCDSTIILSTLLVPLDSCALRVEPSAEPGLCAGDPGRIRLVSDLGAFPVNVSWMLLGSGNPQSGSWPSFFSPYLISNLSDGAYILNLTDANGYNWSDTLIVLSPLPLSAAINQSPGLNGYDLACAGDSTATLQIDYLSGGTLPWNAVWSTGSTATQLTNVPAGLYQVTVTDDHGCALLLMDTITAPPLLQAAWKVTQDPCDGIAPSVENTLLVGGIDPYAFSLNGTIILGSVWPSLPSGSVHLVLRDANNCQVDTIVQVIPEGIFAVDLGPNQFVEEGKLIFLLAQIIPDTIALGSIQWSPELCPNCLNPPFRVKESTTITVTITSAAGCKATDVILIEIDRRNIYIPNSFSPNNDGLNDLFAPQGDPLVRVMDFLIFDRWGDNVYRSGGFQLGDPDVGWNGVARDRPGNVDVYVYAMVLRWPDGQERLYKGDLQLMR